MRRVWAVAVGVVVLMATLPMVCGTAEGGSGGVEGNAVGGACVSITLLPLPWSAESADTWGWAVAFLAAGLAFLAALRLPLLVSRRRDAATTTRPPDRGDAS